MNCIRKARPEDASRIAEILVFSKRTNYRAIFQNDFVSFGEIQVLPLAREYQEDPEKLKDIWVYDDGFIKGMIHIDGQEVLQLYTEPFFTGEGVGGKLLDFAIEAFQVRCLWVLEKNPGAIAFYEKHGFRHRGVWQYEEGTPERLLRMERS